MEVDYSHKEWVHLSGKKTKHYSVEIRTDGERVKRLRDRWGDKMGLNGEVIFLPESKKIYQSDTYDGKEGYKYDRGHDNPGNLTLKARSWKDFTVDGLLANRDPASKCFGYLRGDYVRFDRILEKAGPGMVTVRDKMEKIRGVAHYVIDAKTNRGQYTIWLNPEKGYNFSKATASRGDGDFFMKDGKLDARHKYIISVENTQFTEVDGVWVPVKAKSKLHYTGPNMELNTNVYLEITSIIINPDHDALGSFLIDDIKDGARIFFGDGRHYPYGFVYKWVRGARYVVDDEGRVVSNDPNEGRLPVVKTLPPLKSYKIKKSPRWSKDKMVVMCFIDVEQRASQECAAELKGLEESLAEKGVVVVLVQASEIEAEELDRWKRKNKIRFALGRLDMGGIKELLGAWGVERLPWLILADKEHIVTAEGFGLGELDEKIGAISQK
jgi:hypothetical protein